MNRSFPVATPGARGSARVSMLLVEDDPEYAAVVARLLKGPAIGEVRLDTASSLAAARSALRTHAPDIVLADLNLPDSSGLATLQALARETARPIIVLTGAEDAPPPARAIELGAYEFLRKQTLDRTVLERLLRLAAMQVRAFEPLRANEERFRSLTMLSSDWYWEQDEELRFTCFEGRVTEISGNDPAAAMGRRRWEIPTISPLCGSWDEHKATLAARKPFRDFEYSRVGDDGKLRYISVSGEPVFGARGEFKGYRGIARDITAGKRAAESVRESEERFRSLTELFSDWYWEQDEELRFTILSGGATLAAPALATASIGKRRWEIPGLEPLNFTWEQHRACLEARQPFRDLEYKRIVDSGALNYLSISGRPVFDANGDFKGYRGVSRDITTVRRAEQLLRLEHAVARSIAEAEDVPAALQASMRAVCETECWECGRYFRLDEPAGVMRFTEIWGVPGPFGASFREASQDLAFAPGVGLVGSVWQTGEPLWISDVTHDPRTAHVALAREIGIHSAFVIPISSQGKVIGVIAFSSRQIREPDETLLQAMRLIGGQIGQFLQRKQAEQQLRKSEERFRALTELSSDFYWETDAQHRVRMVQFGPRHKPTVPVDSLIGKARWEVPSEFPDEAGWRQHEATLDAHQPFRDFEFARRTDGELRYFLLSGEPLFDPDGRFTGYRGVGQEITARRKFEARLRQSEQRFQTVFRASPLAMLVTRRDDGRILDANDAMCELGGYSRAALIGQTTLNIGLWADLGARDELLSILDRAGSVQGFEWQLRRRCGELRYVRNWLEGIELDGERCLLGLLLDVTEERLARDGQRRSEAELRESEARFRSLTELSSDWYWEQDGQLRFTHMTGEAPEKAGLSVKSAIGKTRWELPDMTPLSCSWEEHRAMLAARQPFRDFEFRRLGVDGQVYYVSVSGTPVFGEDRAFKGYRGVGRDITRRKRGEEQLRRFRTALDISSDMVFLVNLDTLRLIDFNDTACCNLGYSRDELLGSTPVKFLMQKTEAQLREEYDRLVRSESHSDSYVSRYRRKDGISFPVEIMREVLHSPEGRMMVVTVRDVTERILSEERRAKYTHYQELVAQFGEHALRKGNAEELVEAALKAILDGSGMDAVLYFESGPRSDEYVLRAAAGRAATSLTCGTMSAAADDAVSRVLAGGKPLVLDGPDAGVKPFPSDWADSSGSCATVPVRGERIARGALCALAPQPGAFGTEELKFLDAVASVLSAGLQRIESEHRLAYLAQFDPLTGLPNRVLLNDRFSQAIAHAGRGGAVVGVLFVDLDHFKEVNDTLGHNFGDQLLKDAAGRLIQCIRSGDTVARISGDEFAVVLHDLARAEDAAVVAGKIVDRLALPFDIGNQEMFLTASVGIAVYPVDGRDAEALLSAADAAMYRAKKQGRNRYSFYTAKINERLRARIQLGNDLHRALARSEFRLAYQPKYDLKSGGVCGAEALLRWNHPERGPVSPVEFVPALEDTGLIVQVGEWVLAQACGDIKRWIGEGARAVPVSVNLSARQFRLKNLDARLTGVILRCGVDPALIELEITESQVMHDPEHAIRVMRALTEAGIGIVIDDFGTGYSSLAYLTRFPVSALKIDRSFVKNMTQNPDDATIARTIIEMAHSLGLRVVAEGVETKDQVQFLKLLRCNQAQGFLFARPMPADELTRLLARGEG